MDSSQLDPDRPAEYQLQEARREDIDWSSYYWRFLIVVDCLDRLPGNNPFQTLRSFQSDGFTTVAVAEAPAVEDWGRDGSSCVIRMRHMENDEIARCYKIGKSRSELENCLKAVYDSGKVPVSGDYDKRGTLGARSCRKGTLFFEFDQLNNRINFFKGWKRKKTTRRERIRLR